jgi:uncharacterized protein
MMRFKVSALIRAEVGAQFEQIVDEPARHLGQDLKVDYLRGKLMLTRTDQHILVEGTINTALPAECVRCLDTFSLPLRIRLEELFALTLGAQVADPLYAVAPDGTIDLTLPLREQILLAQPIKPICRPDCKGLCSTCGKNLNEGPCDCDDESIDPRLAALRALL